MSIKRLWINSIVIVGLVFGFLTPLLPSPSGSKQVVSAASATQPVVAIHVSELTQALEAVNATAPTPSGTGSSGKEWFYTSWHYFVIPESLKIALESDGTPYVVVTDADIAAGDLMDGTSPRYPIVISLASEAVNDTEITPLRNYVNAGGFLFVGSSAFTRNPNGTTRGNFALAAEMGLNMATNSLENWIDNKAFTHTANHRLVSHIPAGTLDWNMLNNAEEVVWGTSGAQQLWRTTVAATEGAEIIATGSGYPLLATKGYGAGRFIYHSIFNPIVGAGGQDSGMYAYTIYRNAVEWAFEAANLPIIKRSPWPYAYNAALMVRHDFENSLGSVASIQSSAAYEQTLGLKGDYYFCTGILRTLASGQQGYIDSIRTAVSDYGATIGPHNGGYFNPSVTDPGAYDYWHWGPDIMLDRTDFSQNSSPYSSYTDGYTFAHHSIRDSFQDIEGWLAGLDNGRAGCGAADNCPRIWVSPYFDSGRDRSLKMLNELGTVTMGEQKVSPFPHRTLSYDPATPDHRYAVLALPPSDWYVGSSISQSQESGHNAASIQAAVDYYYQQGYLINLYGHNPTNAGNMKVYADYAVTKPNVWKTNSVGIYDWWAKRDTLVVTPSYSKSGKTATASAAISGSTDAEAAIELVLPNWSLGVVGSPVVRLNGVLADPSAYRETAYGIKVLVGTSVTSLEVDYTPLEGWVQTDWQGGTGQDIWSNTTKYESSTNINHSVAGQFSLNLASAGDDLWSDDFNRDPSAQPTPVPFSWVIPTTTPGATNSGIFNTNGGTLNSSVTTAEQVGFAYPNGLTGTWTDYSIEADIKMPAGSSGGGGFAGRMNLATGTRYGLWIYPSSNILRVVKFSNYTVWNGPDGLAHATIPGIGTGWHHLKMVFSGDTIQAYVDGSVTAAIDITDPGTFGGGVYANGYVGFDYWTSGNNLGPSLNNFIVRDLSNAVLFEDNFGPAPVVADLKSADWSYYGGWTLDAHTAKSTAGGDSNYANIFYSPTPALTDYSVEAKVQFPSGAFGGGLSGRLNPATGTRYTAWVYPGTSELKLIEWTNWNTWAALASVSIPAVGDTWHPLKLDFSGSRIRVFWNNALLIDVVDSATPYMSGGISLDTFSEGGAYLMAVDDVVVRGPTQYQTPGTLTSSAFDGGVGVQWHTIGWDAVAPANTAVCVRTRTADLEESLAAEAWSACYAASGTAVSSLDRRWIQYQVTLSSSDATISPFFYENGISYTPGEYRPASYLSARAPLSGDSQSSVTLSAVLLDAASQPISGKELSFTLGSLAAVSGTTNASGVATATTALALDIAPGDYPITVHFAGDGSYAPISFSTTFHVTENWSEFIQGGSAGFAGGTLEGVDTTTIPGSVILLAQQFGDGEEVGPFTLDSGTWDFRRKIYIDNPNSAALPAGYTLKLSVDTAAMVTAAKLLASGDDLRVVWMNGATPVELDRVADTAFNSSSTEILFKTQALIPASSRDSSYYIYYKNSAAGTPPADPANVFALYDGFDDGTIDTNLWSQTGTVTQSGGWTQLATGGNLYGKQPFTYGTLEMRVQAVTGNNMMWWGWEDGPADAPNFMVFEDYPAGLSALLRNDGHAYQTLALSPSVNVTESHTYTTEWRSGQARWYVDGALVQSATSGVPDTAMRANFNASTTAFNLDWVRGRLTAALEPVVVLSSTYTGYVTQGTFTSSVLDTAGMETWEYLVWDETKPAGTGITMRLRTAATEAGLTTASWIDYPHSAVMITNPAARYVQYQALLTRSDPKTTPELKRIIIYYKERPTAANLNYFRAAKAPTGVELSWETVSEATTAGFNLYRREAGGEFTLVNAHLIPPQVGGQPVGAFYTYLDKAAALGVLYEYKLEMMDINLQASTSLLLTYYYPYSVSLPLVTH